MRDDSRHIFFQSTIHPIFSLLFLLAFALLGLFFGQFVGLAVVLLTSPFSLQELLRFMGDFTAYPQARTLLMTMQAFSAVGAFILAPAIYLKMIESVPFRQVLGTKKLEIRPFLLLFPLVIALMMANAIVIEWNMSIDYGQLFPAFARWAEQKESELEALTTYITSFDHFGSFLLGFLVIAVLPAIGEEILFRGIIQPKLGQFFGNMHAAIWASALLFSAIHMQFFGFFPRLLLGALFGYIYYWSGNLIYAMIAHFINNGFTLVMLYLYQQNLIAYNIDSAEKAPIGNVIIGLVVGLSLLFLFRRYFITYHRYEQRS